MRTQPGAVNRYVAGRVPAGGDAQELVRFLQRELDALQAAFGALADGQIDLSYVAPPKPREGMLRFASGAPDWNPGSGRGMYLYSNSAWRFLG